VARKLVNLKEKKKEWAKTLKTLEKPGISPLDSFSEPEIWYVSRVPSPSPLK